MATISTMSVESVYSMARQVGQNVSYQRRLYTYEYCKQVLRELNLSGDEYNLAVVKIANILGI